MNNELKKLYIILLTTLFISLNLFSNIFININNALYFVKTKLVMQYEDREKIVVNIYDSKANIILMFDDGWRSQYDVAYKYMHEKNMVGSVAIITSTVGSHEYMHISQLYTLYNNGWEILNHTSKHKELSKLNKKEQFREIILAEDWLVKRGFINSNNVLIYPGGDYNSDTKQIIKEMEIISGRGVEEGFNPKKPDNLFDIKIKNVLNHTTPNEIKSWIDYSIENNLTLILLFHRLEEDATDSFMKYEKKNFYKIIDYIDYKKDNLNIITYNDWLQMILSY